MQEGKKDAIPKLDTLLAPDTDSEEEPDVVLQIPANKVKYMVGQGGDKIKYIQRKTKCRVQVGAHNPLFSCNLSRFTAFGHAERVSCFGTQGFGDSELSSAEAMVSNVEMGTRIHIHFVRSLPVACMPWEHFCAKRLPLQASFAVHACS